MPAKTIGLIAHPGKPGVADLVNAMVKEFARFSISVLMETETAKIARQRSDGTIAEIADKCELVVVLGGDGTILNVAGRMGKAIKPIFGINVGSLGFLTGLSSSAYRDAVECIGKGLISFSERTLLEVTITNPAEISSKLIGLNDAVLSRGEISRLVRLRARVNGEPLTEFNADGLIVATPTGSTAYSLSAGGPILTPQAAVFVITPICPHVLTNRSIIVGEDSVIEIEVTEPDFPVYLSVDGRDPLRLERDAALKIRKADQVLPLAVMPDVSFFSVVRQKLRWSGSNL
jgi:NAD+ kinase